MDAIQFVENDLTEKKKHPEFSAGDTVSVDYQIKEGDKVRTQTFKGVVIQRKGQGASETFTVRKVSSGIGVERIFPLQSPFVESIRLEKKGSVRRARIYYLRNRTGKAARIKEKRMAAGDAEAFAKLQAEKQKAKEEPKKEEAQAPKAEKKEEAPAPKAEKKQEPKEAPKAEKSQNKEAKKQEQKESAPKAEKKAEEKGKSEEGKKDKE